MKATLAVQICVTTLGCLLLVLSAPTFAFSVTVLDEATGEPVENAVITVPGSGRAAPDEHIMAQRNRAFQPQVLVVAVGSDVRFPNADDTLHHVYSFSEAKTFDIELYAGEPESPIHFDQVGIVELGCNIHDQMQGFIIVTDHEHSTRTNASGVATLPDGALTNGEPLDIRIWHQRQTDVDRFESRTVNPGASPGAEVGLRLTPEPEGSDEFDDLQQQFQDI